MGLFPTITGGVAMALVSAGVGAATGAGAIGGIREYCDGAGRVLLYFVPPRVLGLAFRVKAQRRALEAIRRRRRRRRRPSPAGSPSRRRSAARSVCRRG